MAADAASRALAQARLDVLPETAAVHWRPRVDEARLRRAGALWTLTTLAHVVPFAGAAALLMWLNTLALPVALACLAHAWVIPSCTPSAGRTSCGRAGARGDEPERRSVGLLGDLVDHEARELHAATGLVLEPGTLGDVARRRSAARCSCADGASTAGASASTGASRARARCRRAIAPRTCCWRCAPTSRASRPSRTSASRARAGACGGGCRRMRPAIHAAVTRQDTRSMVPLNVRHAANAGACARSKIIAMPAPADLTRRILVPVTG